MSKLIIPASAMLGAPLSDDEMKAILGGATTISCSCKWLNGKNTWAQFEINHVVSESDCMGKCASWCASQNVPNQPKVCYETDYNYSSTSTVPGGSN